MNSLLKAQLDPFWECSIQSRLAGRNKKGANYTYLSFFEMSETGAVSGQG